MRVMIYLLVLLFLASLVSAATIHGSIYDLSLDKVEDVIVEVDTEPKQQYISKNGTYAFDVPAGEYTIGAKRYAGDLLESSARERISVKGEGNFVLDLILFPPIDSELAEEIEDISFEDDYFEERDYSLLLLIVVIIIVILFVLYFTERKKPILQEDSKTKGDYYDKVFSIIKENKRITQKDIRKQVPLSEAKISLIITELEHKGLIEKIKKGRGNILILKRNFT